MFSLPAVRDVNISDDMQLRKSSNEGAPFESRDLWMSCEEKIPDRDSTSSPRLGIKSATTNPKAAPSHFKTFLMPGFCLLTTYDTYKVVCFAFINTWS